MCQFLGIKSYELSIFFQTLFTNKQRNREGRRDLVCGLWKKGGGRIPFGFILWAGDISEGGEKPIAGSHYRIFRVQE